MNYQTSVLPNGIRLIHQQCTGHVAYCGLMIDAGSRDETPEQHGIAHFIEHVIFKGTTRRKAWHINSRLEDVGGELNAFTTKEHTCVYATFLNKDYDRTADLIADIVFNPSFPEHELEKEREVIIDEINSYQDTPSELIFDEFEEQVFGDHPLAHPILGTAETIRCFSREHSRQFIKDNYHTDRMVIASIGNITFKQLEKVINRHFAKHPSNYRQAQRLPFDNYIVKKQELNRDTYQAHCLIGNVAYSISAKDRISLSLLNNILGGPGLNSRLNTSLREKHGFTYSVEGNYATFTDTGLASIYFSTDRKNLNKSINLVQKELKQVREKALGVRQLQKAKRQLIGQLAIGQQNLESEMLCMAKSFLYLNDYDSFEDIVQEVEQLTAKDLLRTANEIYEPGLLSMLIYQ